MMFLDGTDLESAYETTSSFSPPVQMNSRERDHAVVAVQSQPVSQPVQAVVQSQVPSSQQLSAPPSQQQYDQESIRQAYMQHQYRMAMQQATAAQQQQPRARQQQTLTKDEAGYFELLGSKKKDMLKLVIMAMMILLALSIHSFVHFLFKEVLPGASLSFRQETGLRLLYPIAIFFVLWNLKVARS